ncbi:TadE/TadG family type IV pilus assembly protein [Pseudomonas borbori]|uniref:Flp pilus assembly protein TadG n=1 Tax=Pseudomonas borbori TaxID=289003 RepID=A0A1I5PAD2_9PSED|nr:TadE/TadG family type IV pilus assembly protein [Pseudomonas borbori]SFP30446.1 Flp pilus assembly protein TadG [Pseudomonas borbori]
MKGSAFKQLQLQRGVAMVEFAIALPLLLLLLLAIGEFGRMLYHYNNLLQANRDAVRYLAGHSWNTTLGRVVIDTTLTTRTKNLAVYGVPVAQPGNEVVPGLTTANVTVSTIGTEHVQVSINYVFQPVIGGSLPALIGNAIPLNIPLVATTVMRGL